MTMKTIAALVAGNLIVAIAILLIFHFTKDSKTDEQYPRACLLKDKAVVYDSVEQYLEFRKRLERYAPTQKEAFAASWITSGQAQLLSARVVDILAMDGPLIVVKDIEGKIYYTTVSQIQHEGEDDNESAEAEDRIEQMVEGR